MKRKERVVGEGGCGRLSGVSKNDKCSEKQVLNGLEKVGVLAGGC